MKHTSTTYDLWQALQLSRGEHPLARQVQRLFPMQGGLSGCVQPLLGFVMAVALPIITSLYFIALLLTLTSSEAGPLLMAILAAIVTVGFWIFLQVFAGIWLLRTITILAGLREASIDDLVRIQPGGGLALHWAISNRSLHIGFSFNSLYTLLYWNLAALGLTIGFTLFVSISVQLGGSDQIGFRGEAINTLQLLIVLVVIGTLLVVEFAQSIIISLLTGMLMPLYAGSIEARIRGVSLYAGSQLVAYFMTIGGAYAVFIIAMQITETSESTALVVMPVIIAPVMFTIREIIIRRLWMLLLRRLNAHASELDFIIGIAR